MKKRNLIALSLIVAIVGSFTAFALRLAMSEDLRFSKRHIAYFLLTPEMIKNIPRPGMVGEEEFYHSCGDGPKPIADGVRFESAAQEEVLIARIDAFLRASRYTLRKRDSQHVLNYENGEDGVRVMLRPSQGGNVTVAVDFATSRVYLAILADGVSGALDEISYIASDDISRGIRR